MKIVHTLFLAFGWLLAASVAEAQSYQLQSGNFNPISTGGVLVGDNQASLPATVNSNYRGMGMVAGSSGPISTSGVDANASRHLTPP